MVFEFSKKAETAGEFLETKPLTQASVATQEVPSSESVVPAGQALHLLIWPAPVVVTFVVPAAQVQLLWEPFEVDRGGQAVQPPPATGFPLPCRVGYWLAGQTL